jgi:hypothetical protein
VIREIGRGGLGTVYEAEAISTREMTREELRELL